MTIENAEGRQRLIEVMCTSTELLAAYNAAARKLAATGEGGAPPLWSDEIIEALQPPRR